MAQRRARGVLKVKRSNAAGLIKRAKLMKQGLDKHAQKFDKPNPPAANFGDQIDKTDAAQLAADGGGKAQTAARDVEVGVLHGMMLTQLAYIQSVADAGTADVAVQTLHDGGVEVAGHTPHDKPVLGAVNGVASGSAELEANARSLLGGNLHRKHLFCWAYTTNGGQTFVNLPPTPKARTTVTGLTPLTTVGFRVAVTTSNGVTGPWSPAADLLIR